MEKLRPRGGVGRACQKPQSRISLLGVQTQGRALPLPTCIHQIDPSSPTFREFWGSRDSGHTPLQQQSCLSGVRTRAWVGPWHHWFRNLNNHRQSPLAEGRGRKEVRRRPKGLPPGPGVEERRGLNVQSCWEMLAFTPRLQRLRGKNTTITGLSFRISRMDSSLPSNAWTWFHFHTARTTKDWLWLVHFTFWHYSVKHHPVPA